MILLSIAAEKTGDFVMVKEMDIGKFPRKNKIINKLISC